MRTISLSLRIGGWYHQGVSCDDILSRLECVRVVEDLVEVGDVLALFSSVHTVLETLVSFWGCFLCGCI